ncbi:MAG: fibronectin type III domain-containing protein [Saprospiraceae bacterium]
MKKYVLILVSVVLSLGLRAQTITLEIKTDHYPNEIYWEIRNSGGAILHSRQSNYYTAQYTVYTEQYNLSPGTYTFNIWDVFGDGICCFHGIGYYKIINGGTLLIEGGNYGAGETKTFTVVGAAPLEIPTGVAATPTSSSAISVSWTSVSGATSYAVDQALNNTFTSGLQTFTAATNSYSATGLAASTTYYFRVRAVNSAGASGNSAVAQATTQSGVTIPSIPTSVTATATSSSAISVAWASVAGATSYVVDQALNNTFTSGLQTFTAATNSYSATGLTASTTYYYRVRAVNSAGASGNSAVAQATTQSGVATPSIPTSVTATATSSSAISVAWASVVGATSYAVDQALNNTFTTSLQTFTSASNSYSASGLTASTTYYYRVRAVNSAGASGNSTVVQATTSTSGGGGTSQWTTSGTGIYHMNPVHIGKSNTNTGAESGYSLYVANGIKAEKFKLEIGSAGGWADYVFDKNYELMPLDRLKEYIEKNKHLPGFPSEKKIMENKGYEMGDMVKKQQEALENLHLYVLQLEQKILELEKKLLIEK